jgi:hypothetical protein
MAKMHATRKTAIATVASVLILMVNLHGQTSTANERPVADAGSSRYTAGDSVQLDGRRSFDPDHSGELTFAWRQVSGPLVAISEADTATPRIGGSIYTDERGRTVSGPFVQTDAIQECQFELVVSDGELTSMPDTVKATIVPAFGPTILQLENPPFRPDRPTIIFFGGGDGTYGYGVWIALGDPWTQWHELANWIDFPQGYGPDASGPDPWRTYYHYGDMVIAYLSSVAPEYTGMIQTLGFSTGGQPAVDTAIRLNRVYRDPRYAVNQVTEFDAPSRWQGTGWQAKYISPWEAYMTSNALLHSSAVDGEPFRHDHYWGEAYRLVNVPHDLTGIYLEGHDHMGVPDWYRTSLTSPRANEFNHGVVAGPFWSVVGPGKNLQTTTDPVGYYFHKTPEGEMVMFDPNSYPGRFPEPVTLTAWLHSSDTSDAGGVVLSCHYSENAVSYQLLLGSDPHRVTHYQVISETPAPPTDILKDAPSRGTWWTVRVRDQYGSTIYADPIRLDPTGLQPLSVQNARTGKRYGCLDHALQDAQSGDHLLLGPGTYVESVELGGKMLTVSSLDPDDPEIVAGTIITSGDSAPAVTFAGPESAACVLEGLTIQSETLGVSCRDTAPTIRDCVVGNPGGIALEFWWGYRPNLIGCTFLGQVKEGGDPGLAAYWRLDETEGMLAHDSVGGHDGTITGAPQWRPQGGTVEGALELDGKTFITAPSAINPADGSFSILAWVKGGTPGQSVISQVGGANWLMADAAQGTVTTGLANTTRGNTALPSQTIITDGNWHRVAFTWDRAKRQLYVDGALVAEDAQGALVACSGDLIIGAARNTAPGTFWSGLIDDVRIYDRAVRP